MKQIAGTHLAILSRFSSFLASVALENSSGDPERVAVSTDTCRVPTDPGQWSVVQ